MKKITDEQFTKALEAVVKERGEDYTYPREEENPDYWILGSCVYQVEGRPACIIGAAIAHLGGDLAGISSQNTNPGKAVKEAGLEVSGSVSNAMSVAQRAQDIGKTWGDALRAYYDYFWQ